jgi:hypothetical protein
MTQVQPNAQSPTTTFWPAVFAASVLSALAPVLYFGIHKFTHHRPLGGATLAVATMAAFVFLLAVAWRLKVGRTPAVVAVVVTTIGLAMAAFTGSASTGAEGQGVTYLH